MIAKVEGGVTSYFLSDRLSTRLVLDSTGNVTGRQAHLPYGEEIGSSGATDKHRFTSYERDSETALDYAINRGYSLATGRFIQTDPYSGSGDLSDPQTLNRYTYSANDPVGLYDPFGRIASRSGGKESWPGWEEAQKIINDLAKTGEQIRQGDLRRAMQRAADEREKRRQEQLREFRKIACSEAVLDGMDKIWDKSKHATSDTEYGFVAFETTDGKIEITPVTGDTSGEWRFRGTINGKPLAIFHSHRARKEPRPSNTVDIPEANKTGYKYYVIHQRGVYAYDPKIKETYPGPVLGTSWRKDCKNQ
jgi:RHS repeat-associated protein